MHTLTSKTMLARLVGYAVIVYGLSTVWAALDRQLHGHLDIDGIFITIPQVLGLGAVYLGSLLVRQKYAAWLAAILLLCLITITEVTRTIFVSTSLPRPEQLAISVFFIGVLWFTRDSFRVRSDRQTFGQAVGISAVVLVVTFMYGIVGFSLLGRHEVGHEFSVMSASHDTLRQMLFTSSGTVTGTRRAHVFVDSLSIMTAAAIIYSVVGLFGPIRVRLAHPVEDIVKTTDLLRDYPNEIDDYFKIWPHDKQYYLNKQRTAGVAYKVIRDFALIVGEPFGNPREYSRVSTEFKEFCFVNDWKPVFIHVRDKPIFKKLGYKLQKIGQDAVLDIALFQTRKNAKYFRQIRNRFTKLGYSCEMLTAPYADSVLAELRIISRDWLKQPGRAERTFMVGHHTDEYIQRSRIYVLRRSDGSIGGFINLVPTFVHGTANYDLLRCATDMPGNSSDYLLLGLIEHLHAEGIHTLNLGLSPLSGMDEDSKPGSVIDAALRLIYANGDRFYSFSGLRRFKDKYKPTWTDYYVAYTGTPASFVRVINAVAQAMKYK